MQRPYEIPDGTSRTKHCSHGTVLSKSMVVESYFICVVICIIVCNIPYAHFNGTIDCLLR